MDVRVGLWRKLSAEELILLWGWRRLLRVSWIARGSNQSILKEIKPEYSLEGLMLKLKLRHFGHLMWRTNSLEKILMLRKIEVRKRREWQRMSWLDFITNAMDMSLSRLWELVMDWEGKPGVLQSMGSQKVGHTWATQLNWTELKFERHLLSKWRYWTTLWINEPELR